ncbi:ABC transporter ATP-binding protein/permease [Streptomyces sp. NBC_01221]|uniref:ABC transporter ATP-binding protein n=1 Tax=unclassified Streptomyces TaxID=2593676 RepID=UPI00225936CA|nr:MULTISPECIES: ABC transporter ATP-binding protein [unclassified Streptomyces]WSP54220.1 ABC transporter ATP-binding protein/permease [Streptomyces sp. NBC_01241]WSU25106.1 ABC transporter ATP-binding protein/permease [Streptomyces sp. NBC_01108]MCX4785731.1 ABC transporter ATP-binding protein/permease [Streptomyces sp. NBC_01221]MCX4798411.1 ABC transporter ATP-binding protein/permease [Streptomyces sp. NBC_01242]WSJ39640.1 ABC transporter ATP-binding protein/permease [Streptomyces sp. NBC_
MSMEATAWTQLHNVMNAQADRRPFDRATLRRIAAFARPHRRRVALFLLLSVATALLAVATPVLAGRVVNAIVAGQDGGTVTRLSLLIAVIAVAEAALGLAGRWLSANLGEGLILDLRTAVFDHVQRMPIAFFTRTRTGALVSRLNNDVIGAQRAFSNTLSGVVSNVVTLLLTLGVMLSISWQITVLALVLLPVFVLPARRMGTRMARLQREAAAHNAAMGTRMTERFSAPGATLIKLFGRPADESAEFAARAGRVRDIGVRTAMAQSAFITALTLVSALALALVYGLGGFYALRGQLDAGAVVALALLLTRLYAPLTSLAGARVEVMSALVSFERVFEVLDLKPLIDQKPDARAVPEGPVSVEFDRVRFGYPSADKVSLASLEDVATLDTRGGDEVLRGVSFRAEPGQTVALVGSSGAGKSTIAQLLPRLYDTEEGSVRIGGIDVRDLSAETLRDTLGMVTQDGHLFHESVRANLLLARPEATEEDLWDALRRSRLDGLVASLPDGLDTVVGERGYRLSGGERQRLTIARLLLARQRVVILDEATAHLDNTSEAAVQEALTEALAGRTAVVIAHRLSTVRAADLILVVENGQIVERGTHEGLLAAGGRYEELYRTQFETVPHQ